jgi:hypothetical protein
LLHFALEGASPGRFLLSRTGGGGGFIQPSAPPFAEKLFSGRCLDESAPRGRRGLRARARGRGRGLGPARSASGDRRRGPAAPLPRPRKGAGACRAFLFPVLVVAVHLASLLEQSYYC